MVPVMEPLPVMPRVVSVIVAVPVNEAPVCVSCQSMTPGPEVSLAEPLHVPPRLSAAAGGDAGDGCVGAGEDPPPPPPQPATMASTHVPINMRMALQNAGRDNSGNASD